MIITMLIVSTIFNIFFVWYIYNLLKKLLFVSDNIGDFLEVLQDYSEHIETVYNMETYYGDEVIERLLEHSRQIVKEIEGYKEIYNLIEEENEENEESEESKGITMDG
jgi:cell shape-determining protein MreC